VLTLFRVELLVGVSFGPDVTLHQGDVVQLITQPQKLFIDEAIGDGWLELGHRGFLFADIWWPRFIL
jgi:hypothetical protein